MPREFRRLTFSTRELCEAITRYDVVARRLPRRSSIVCVDIIDGPLFGLRLACADRDDQLLQAVALDAGYVGAALVLYCLDHAIPFPKAGTRTVVPHADGVALCLYLDEPVRPGETVLPDFYDYDFFG